MHNVGGMSLALSPETLLFLAMLALVAVVALVSWAMRRDRKKWTYRQQTGDMLLDRLKAANLQVAAVVKAENDAIQSVGVLPEEVDPLEAERVLRAAMPDSSFHDRRALMQHAWEAQKQPQALVALAGMALADLENTYSSLNVQFRTVMKEGSPALLGHIALGLDRRRHQIDNWLRVAGLPLQLELAASRIAGEAPDVAERLRSLAQSLLPRWGELLMQKLRLEVGNWEEKEDVSPLEMAVALAQSSLPRFPELVAEVHAALDRHEGPQWDKAHAWFDKAVLHRFYDLPIGLRGFDRDAAIERFADGIMSSDAEVSRFIAEQAADLLGDGFFDAPHHGDALQGALDWAVGLHGTNPTYEWLEAELNAPNVREEKLRAAEESIALHAQVNVGVAKVMEATSTLDPDVALAELRQVVPGVPMELLRVALIARWHREHEPMSLVALLGVALEAAESEPVDGKMVSLCVHWPLRDGSAAVVDAAVLMLEERFERLDSWVHRERSILDLESGSRRLAEMAPATAGRVGALLERAKERRVPLLAQSIAERLKQVEAEAEAADPFRMMLDVYRWCLPHHPELGAPVRHLLRVRDDDIAWRKTQFWLESSIIKHFGPLGQLAGYDLEALIDLLYDGIADHSEEVAVVAAMTATDLIKRNIISNPDHLLTLEGAVDWAVPLHHTLPQEFSILRDEIRAAYGRVSATAVDG